MYERAGSQGHLQSIGYTIRFFGSVLGALVSTFVNKPLWYTHHALLS
jgi:hypothetical protein